jgi:hypothetical protein
MGFLHSERESQTATSAKTDVPVGAATATVVERGEVLDSGGSGIGQLSRWGGVAALAGVASMVGAVIVVVALGLPDAADPETLTDFADIESGRIAEHFLYLGALVLFALHVFVLNRLLRAAHSAAALFGTVLQAFGLVILAASAMLHVSTVPLARLYTAPGASPENLRAIEYSWTAAQSVFDTMLATGLLLVPIGIALMGLALRGSDLYGRWLSWIAIILGLVGTIGAAIEVVDTERSRGWQSATTRRDSRTGCPCRSRSRHARVVPQCALPGVQGCRRGNRFAAATGMTLMR